MKCQNYFGYLSILIGSIFNHNIQVVENSQGTYVDSSHKKTMFNMEKQAAGFFFFFEDKAVAKV
jgi:hypothetical protein